jgi:hypothetical protein
LYSDIQSVLQYDHVQRADKAQGVANMTIKKVGGIWFLKLGRLGFSFYISRRKGA